MTSELAIWVVVIALALMAIGTLAKRASSWLFMRNVQKLRDAIATDSMGADDTLSDEETNDNVKLIQLVQFKCSHAENYILEGKADRLERTVLSCLEHADKIKDDYYRSVALNHVANLLRKAGATDRALGIEAIMPVKPGELTDHVA